MCLQSVSCHVIADLPGFFSYRKSHSEEMGIVINEVLACNHLKERDCFILGRALDPVTRPCTVSRHIS